MIAAAPWASSRAEAGVAVTLGCGCRSAVSVPVAVAVTGTAGVTEAGWVARAVSPIGWLTVAVTGVVATRGVMTDAVAVPSAPVVTVEVWPAAVTVTGMPGVGTPDADTTCTPTFAATWGAAPDGADTVSV